MAGFLVLSGCSDSPATAPTGPFAVEGAGPASIYVYPTEIDKELTRRVGPSCPNGFDVVDLTARRNPGRMTADLIRYRAIVQCRTEATADPGEGHVIHPRF
jgi:hypothetical protein